MPIVSLDRLLQHASDNKYAVGAFVSMNIEIIQAAIRAAEKKNSPVVIRIHPDSRQITSFDTLTAVAKQLASRSSVPVGLSLDHGNTLADTVDAIRAGCTSVMLDAAEEPLEENIRRVRQVVEVAKPLGILVEAAVGHMEHGAVQGDDDLANVEEAVKLVRESGATILAPAIGNVHGSAHGETKATSNLAIERIRELREATGVPICMHGGSGTPRAQMRAATQAGVALVILFSDIITAYNTELKRVLDSNRIGIAIIDALVPAQHAAQAVIEEKMDDLGSAGQASAFSEWARTLAH
ncbi:class II fructose-bisphosphate aldolase [Mesorhizobium sp. RP14(2022)]|uniref:Class II fructose-bisphosphate aldolase n=1 Tax=Mesorhizobium liriopis TaxID=2953882 RepID=A0ABT1C6Q0_9HYPH|nr:class II fructose-bisphosphate aldolase [Mesorhizobium liriopis]MCO6050504.1 class II fructose-bisphosphate aldolase [Mesorhizobium liriopis]